MIVETKNNTSQSVDLLDSPTDEPPAYDQVTASASSASASSSRVGPSASVSYFPRDAKVPFAASTGIGLRPTSPSKPSGSQAAGGLSPATKAPAGWLAQLVGTPQAKQDKEVRQTVLSLVSF